MKTAQHFLKQHFGFDDFRFPQAEIISHIMDGHNALVIMPTGSGKSICYQIPALMLAGQRNVARRPLTLVLSPLIALMKDQVDSLQGAGIAATFINSSLNKRERETRYKAVAEGKYCVLYVTPERFRKSEFLDVIAQRDIKLLAIDEAHCISEWGHDFRPDYTRMAEFRSIIGNPVTMALTATATPEVQQDIVTQLGLKSGEMRMFHEGIDRPNLELRVEEIWDADEKQESMMAVFDRWLQPGTTGSGIVYFTLIRTLIEFSDRLRAEGIDHVCYHGDLERFERRTIQDDFMKGQSRLVLATNAFGNGC
jgi:ATP-dependent DNA helicase RecQ